MRLFYGTCRKLSTLPVFVFFVGWGFYLVGFLRKMIKPTPLLPRWDNYPAFIAAGVGPVFILTALLQSCLGGTTSAAMGSVAAAASVIFLVSLGNSSITSAHTLYHYNSSISNSTDEGFSVLYVASTLVGSIMCCLGVTLLLGLWSSYQDPRDPPRDPPRDCDEDNEEQEQGSILLHNGSTGTGTSSVNNTHHSREVVCRSSLFPGFAKKMAVPCLVLSFVGWAVMVGGHYHRINSVPEEGQYANDVLMFDFGQWGACVLTPLLLFFGLMHAAATGSANTVMGVVNAVLNGVVLVAIGYDMVHDMGEWLKKECESKCDYTLPQNAGALCEIVGSFVMCFFWSAVLGLWPFYKKQPSKTELEDTNMVSLSGYTRTHAQFRPANTRDYIQEEDDDNDIQPLQV